MKRPQLLHELFASRDPRDVARACRQVLRMAGRKGPAHALTLERNPASPRYGHVLALNPILGQAARDGCRADLGEYTNGTDFSAAHLHADLAISWYRFRHKMSARVREAFKDYYRHGLGEFFDSRYWWVTGHNAALSLNAFALVAGQVLELPSVTKLAYRRFLDLLRAEPYTGLTGEYNSPTYVWHGSLGLAVLASFGERAEYRLVGRMLLERRLMQWALRYHPGMREIAGPWSRNYGLTFGGPLSYIYKGVGLDNRPARRDPKKQPCHATLFDFPLPPEFVSFFSERKVFPYTARETHQRYCALKARPVAHPRLRHFVPVAEGRFMADFLEPISFDAMRPYVWSTTYLHKDYTLGSTGGRARLWSLVSPDHTRPMMCQYAKPGAEPPLGFLNGSWWSPLSKKRGFAVTALGTHVQAEGGAVSHYVACGTEEEDDWKDVAGPARYRFYADYLTGTEEVYADGKRVSRFPARCPPGTVFHFRDGNFFAAMIPLPLNTAVRAEVRYALSPLTGRQRLEIDLILPRRGAGPRRAAGYALEVASAADLAFTDFMAQTRGRQPRERWVGGREWRMKYRSRAGHLLEIRGPRGPWDAPLSWVDGQPVPRQALESPWVAESFQHDEVRAGEYRIRSGHAPVLAYTDVAGENLVINNPYLHVNLEIRRGRDRLTVKDFSLGQLRLSSDRRRLKIETAGPPPVVNGKGKFGRIKCSVSSLQRV